MCCGVSCSSIGPAPAHGRRAMEGDVRGLCDLAHAPGHTVPPLLPAPSSRPQHPSHTLTLTLTRTHTYTHTHLPRPPSCLRGVLLRLRLRLGSPAGPVPPKDAIPPQLLAAATLPWSADDMDQRRPNGYRETVAPMLRGEQNLVSSHGGGDWGSRPALPADGRHCRCPCRPLPRPPTSLFPSFTATPIATHTCVRAPGSHAGEGQGAARRGPRGGVRGGHGGGPGVLDQAAAVGATPGAAAGRSKGEWVRRRQGGGDWVPGRGGGAVPVHVVRGCGGCVGGGGGEELGPAACCIRVWVRGAGA